MSGSVILVTKQRLRTYEIFSGKTCTNRVHHMKMHWIDWSIIVFLLGSLLIITIYTRKYMKSVADFLAANRLAGRYMLTVSSGFGGANVSLVLKKW